MQRRRRLNQTLPDQLGFRYTATHWRTQTQRRRTCIVTAQGNGGIFSTTGSLRCPQDQIFVTGLGKEEISVKPHQSEKLQRSRNSKTHTEGDGNWRRNPMDLKKLR